MISDTFTIPNVFILLSSFMVIAIIVAICYYLSVRRLKYYIFANARVTLLNPLPFSFAGIILGIGIGGFTDGILFHQILQWHSMLSGKLPPDTVNAKSVNMFWDGIFHAFTLLIVLTGLIALWNASRHSYVEKSGKLLAGGMLCGWGIFNLVEGIINHHIFRLHNVRDKSVYSNYYNYAFLIISIMVLAVGTYALSRYYKNIFKVTKS